jgi:NAD-dependent histone deacetylase SIR2
VEFDVQLLGNCDDVVVELARRAGWDLRHEMVDANKSMKVGSFEDAGHWWTVRKEGEVPKIREDDPDARDQNGSSGDDGAPNGSEDLQGDAEGAA